MQVIWILLLAVQIICSRAAIPMTKTYHEERLYGEQLSIMLSPGAEILHFTSVDETEQDILWSRTKTNIRGIVTGRYDNRKFVINSVTFDNEGTYTVLNFRNRKMSIHLLKVFTKRSFQNCVAGQTFRIPLAGLVRNDATLNFSNQDFKLTLVAHGSPLANSHPEYMGRIQVTSDSIELLSCNVSDVGNYTLCDHRNRKVKIILMNLVDHPQRFPAGPLTAVLLFLGIPPCICCCCRKICKKSNKPTNTTAVKLDDQINPPGPPPAYDNLPALADPIPGFSPVTYNAPPGPEPATGKITPTTPLLTPPQPEVAQNPAREINKRNDSMTLDYCFKDKKDVLLQNNANCTDV